MPREPLALALENLNRAREALNTRGRQIDMLRDDLRGMRADFRIALEALGQPSCNGCEGTGGVEIIEDHTRPDAFTVDERLGGWTDPDHEACDLCWGTGYRLREETPKESPVWPLRREGGE